MSILLKRLRILCSRNPFCPLIMILHYLQKIRKGKSSLLYYNQFFLHETIFKWDLFARFLGWYQLLIRPLTIYSWSHNVGSKARGKTSKQALQGNKAGQIFQETNISYPLICTRTCSYQGLRNVRFSENLVCFVFL